MELSKLSAALPVLKPHSSFTLITQLWAPGVFLATASKWVQPLHQRGCHRVPRKKSAFLAVFYTSSVSGLVSGTPLVLEGLPESLPECLTAQEKSWWELCHEKRFESGFIVCMSVRNSAWWLCGKLVFAHSVIPPIRLFQQKNSSAWYQCQIFQH